ncbi:hypothetical protein JCM14469_27520 [Desulfatiferula olefinivorans]
MKTNQLINRWWKTALGTLVLLAGLTVNALGAVTLPFTDNFDDNSLDLTAWDSVDRDGDSGSAVFEIYKDYNWWGALRSSSLHIAAYGEDVWNSNDEYASLYLNDINGDFVAIVQIRYQENTDGWGKCGFMVKNDITTTAASSGYMIWARTPNNGFTLQVDGDDNGYLGTTWSTKPNIAPPNAWLKLEKTVQATGGAMFTVSYSSDGSNWAPYMAYTENTAAVVQDVGLFVTSHDDNDRCSVLFDNFTITGSGAQNTYYYDGDDDGFGDPNNTTMALAQPVDYVTDNTDCDDDDGTTYPGATEVCDGKDNDCDGTIDDGVGTTTYYYDGDGDGYGTNANTQVGCSAPAGYSENGGDCNDADAGIHPGAFDVCGDGIDQDCSGTDRPCATGQVCMDIADVPLSTQLKAAPPLIMFVLDDSGSMAWDVLCPENNGLFNGESSVGNVKSYWRSQYNDTTSASNYSNGIYYNPAVDYTPWPTLGNADPDNPRIHPIDAFGTGTRGLSTTFTTLDGVPVKYAHWYMWSAIDNAPYLVNLDGGAASYYKVTNYGSGDYGRVYDLSHVATPPSDVAITRSYTLERQNFANWYTYYRTRELVAKAALGRVLNGVKAVKVGIHSINHSVIEPVRSIGVEGETDNKAYMLDRLYHVDKNGGTPLRQGLEDAGQYFHADDGDTGNIGASPYADESDGGACQQAYTIVMTDGYYNGSSPSVGNADGDNNTDFDGTPYGDTTSNTLADVAMYYYENDLNANLANGLQPNDRDSATHQHMVTYTVSFGLTGTLTPTASCPETAADCPAWPAPTNDDRKIDDLWHAAVNGRGDYLSAADTQALIDALSQVMADIQDRARTSAPVTLNTQKLESDTDLYQGFFDAADWSGDLHAYDLLADGSVNQTASWSARAKLVGVAADDREILTYSGSAAVPFRYASLTTDQKTSLDPNAVTAERLLNYIRGDNTHEVANGGALRDRSSVLGDIVNSSPIYENGMVYVGANDGMLHAFNATTGVEEFAFVPSRVIENLRHYADVTYAHRYFVDGTVNTATIGTTTWLVGGLGKGGRGIFGIDITDPAAITETNRPTIWEFPQGVDDDMGFSFSTMSIVPANNGDTVAIFGNGYDSPNGRAVLYIVKMDGTLVRKIDTGVGNNTTQCNGLSSPVVIDVNYDGKADFVFAGDLLGNMWKFDIRSTVAANWDVYFKDASTNAAQPLFQAKDKGGTHQAITASPDVMLHCDRRLGGLMVVFGTGRYLSFDDIPSTQPQTIYGIWDWSAAWERLGESSSDKSLGAVNVPAGTPAVRTLANIEASTYIHSDIDLILLEQTQTVFAGGWRETTYHEINWFNPSKYLELKADGDEASYAGGRHVGWFFDLPLERERVFSRTQIRDGKAVVVSVMPADSPCSAGGSSVVHIMDACSGGELQSPQFDTNDDDTIDSDDDPKTGKYFEGEVYFDPAILEDKMYFSRDEIEETTSQITGLYYWRMF